MKATVLLCRGCCCGTADKHPRTDHDPQEQALLEAAAAFVAGGAQGDLPDALAGLRFRRQPPSRRR